MDKRNLDEKSRTLTNIFTRKRRGTRVIDRQGALVHPAADCSSRQQSAACVVEWIQYSIVVMLDPRASSCT